METQGLKYKRIAVTSDFFRRLKDQLCYEILSGSTCLLSPPHPDVILKFNIDGKEELKNLKEVKKTYLVGKQPSDCALALAY